MTVFLDTCIVIDALANRAPFYKEAQEILVRGSERKLNLLLSAKSFLDIHYVLKHFFHDESVVRAHLSSLLNAVTLVSTSPESCVSALQSITSDYEDGVQAATALDEGADYILTRDEGGYANSAVPPMSPKDFLPLLNQGPTE